MYFKNVIFVVKTCKYGIFVAKIGKYGIFVAKIYKYALIDRFQGSAGFLDSAANCAALAQPQLNIRLYHWVTSVLQSDKWSPLAQKKALPTRFDPLACQAKSNACRSCRRRSSSQRVSCRRLLAAPAPAPRRQWALALTTIKCVMGSTCLGQNPKFFQKSWLEGFP